MWTNKYSFILLDYGLLFLHPEAIALFRHIFHEFNLQASIREIKIHTVQLYQAETRAIRIF